MEDFDIPVIGASRGYDHLSLCNCNMIYDISVDRGNRLGKWDDIVFRR